MTLDPATTTKVTTHTFNCFYFIDKKEEHAPFERSIHQKPKHREHDYHAA